MIRLTLALTSFVTGAAAAFGPVAGEVAPEPTRPPSCCDAPGRSQMLVQRTLARSEGDVGAGLPATKTPATTSPASVETPDGMVWIPGGEFSMGSTDPLARPDERPVHRVRVDGFWMDVTEVTNAQFRAFTEATGYETIAERPVDWEQLKQELPEGTPKPPDAMLRPGSLVFTPPDHPVDLRRFDQWWSWTIGANWRHPEGPDSTIEGRDAHPVVHIAYLDAVAYCRWAGKRLPTEAEWEFAARGGMDGKINVWGDEPVDPTRCNIWQGHFPDTNTAMAGGDGFLRAAPVKSFTPNGYGLYDMAGNVWEWTNDLFRPDTYARRVLAEGPDICQAHAKGPDICQAHAKGLTSARRVQGPDIGRARARAGHRPGTCKRAGHRPGTCKGPDICQARAGAGNRRAGPDIGQARASTAMSESTLAQSRASIDVKRA